MHNALMDYTGISQLFIVRENEKLNDLLTNLNRIHTTPLGAERIKKNLGFDIADVVAWSQQKIKTADHTVRKAKNWYVYVDGLVLTINAHSFTIITAHKEKTEHTGLY